MKSVEDIPEWFVVTRPDIITWGSFCPSLIQIFDYFYSVKHGFYPDGIMLIRADIFLNIRFLDTNDLEPFQPSIEAIRHAMLQRESMKYSFQKYSYAVHKRDKLPIRKLPIVDLIKILRKY